MSVSVRKPAVAETAASAANLTDILFHHTTADVNITLASKAGVVEPFAALNAHTHHTI